MGEMVDSQEAARRLGIKLATLYSYVSRGILQSHPSPDARRRLFDVEDVDRIGRRGRSGRQPDDQSIRIATAITELLPSGPSYRGTPAAELAASSSFEEVARLLWQADGGGAWRALELPTPPEMATRHRLKWAIMMSGARTSLASDMRRPSIVAMATDLLATIVATLPAEGAARRSLLAPAGASPHAGSLAGRLAGRLAPAAPTSEARCPPSMPRSSWSPTTELTPPTLAVRIAASSRANYYDAMLVGAAASSAPAHGSASELAHALLVDAEREGPEQAMDDALRLHGVLPGFGRREYPDGDPRFAALKPRYERIGGAPRLEVIAAVLELAALHHLPRPSVDFALGAITFAADMPRSAGLTIFSVARIAGWTAHFLEELDEPPLRFRPITVPFASR